MAGFAKKVTGLPSISVGSVGLNKDFTKTFALAEYVEVKDAVVVDGILVIELEKNIPEEEKPKKRKKSRKIGSKK